MQEEQEKTEKEQYAALVVWINELLPRIVRLGQAQKVSHRLFENITTARKTCADTYWLSWLSTNVNSYIAVECRALLDEANDSRSLRRFHSALKRSLEFVTYENWSQYSTTKEQERFQSLWGNSPKEKRDSISRLLPAGNNFDVKITKDYTNYHVTHILQTQPDIMPMQGNYNALASDIVRAGKRLVQLVFGDELVISEVPQDWASMFATAKSSNTANDIPV